MKENKLWFKTKLYGWGWVPYSWEGWVITALYMFAVIKGAWAISPELSEGEALLTLAITIVPPTIFLLVICYLKGERPRWRWGK